MQVGRSFGRTANEGLAINRTARAVMSDEQDTSLARSLQSLHENIRRAGPAATASYSLTGAIILLGGAGLLVDRWQGTAPWGLLAGLALGLVVGFYQLAMVMWRR